MTDDERDARIAYLVEREKQLLEMVADLTKQLVEAGKEAKRWRERSEMQSRLWRKGWRD